MEYNEYASHLVAMREHVAEYWATYASSTDDDHQVRKKGGQQLLANRKGIIQFTRRSDGARFSSFVDNKVIDHSSNV